MDSVWMDSFKVGASLQVYPFYTAVKTQYCEDVREEICEIVGDFCYNLNSFSYLIKKNPKQLWRLLKQQ